MTDDGVHVFSDVATVGQEDRAAALRHSALTSNPCASGADSPNLLLLDGPDHMRLRAVVRKIIAGLEPLPESACNATTETVTMLAERSHFDLVTDFARPVAALVAQELVGADLPFDDRFLDDIEATAANLDIWFQAAPSGAGTSALRIALLLARAPAVPGRGMELLRTAHEHGQIDADELFLTPVMLAHAAYENSRNFLALAGLRVVREPDLLRDTPAAAVVRELAADLTPVRLVMRRACEQVELATETVAAGTKVAIPLDGMPFGLGRHVCPGSRVALAEAEIALQALAAVLPDGGRVCDLRWKSHPAFHGLETATVVPGPEP